jgi:putative membrane protein
MTLGLAPGVDGAPGWSFEPVVIAGSAVVGLAYAVRARNLRRRGRRVAPWRQLCFYAGLATVLIALVSPIDTIGEERVFYVHMVQHLLIADVASLLVLLGLSGPMLRPLLAVPAIRPLRHLTNPLVALPLWALVFYVWHLPVLYEAALASTAVHALEHALFFAAGLLMWAAVIEPVPGPAWFGSGAKAAYVLVVRALGAILGSIFIWVGRPLYPGYGAGERIWGISPLTDQQIGGAIMFVEGGLVTLVVFAWLFLRWSREAELRQSLLDAGAGPRVATRTARYGRRAVGPPARPPSP